MSPLRRPQLVDQCLKRAVCGRLPMLGFVAAITACGSAQGATAPPSPVPTIAPVSPQALTAVMSASRRTSVGSVSVSLNLAAASVFGASPAPLVGSGVLDLASGRGRVTLQQPVGDEVVVFVPASVFVRQPVAMRGALPRGKTWISAGLTEFSTRSTNLPQFVIQAEGINPAFLLDQLVWGAVSAAPLGQTYVNGGSAHGFLVRVDLARASSSASGPSGAAFTRAIGYELNAAGVSGGAPRAVQNVRVWIDAGGRVVQLQASPPGSGVGVTTMTFSSFGTSVRLRIPPRSQVVDIASLTPGGERENGGGDSDAA
jgi:hypothetical protein